MWRQRMPWGEPRTVNGRWRKSIPLRKTPAGPVAKAARRSSYQSRFGGNESLSRSPSVESVAFLVAHGQRPFGDGQSSTPSSMLMMERSMQDHKFTIGQSVNFISGPFGRGSANGVYTITQLLPYEGDDCQYRIKAPLSRTSGSPKKIN